MLGRIIQLATTATILFGRTLAFSFDLPGPKDCSDIKTNANSGTLIDGVYRIWPIAWPIVGSFTVYCDMTTDGGGWTLVQRRDADAHESFFNTTWKSYKIGFGNLLKSYWLGNDRLFALTNQDVYELRIDLTDSNNNTGYAKYKRFWVEDENHYYKLHIRNYTGNIGDAFGKHDGWRFQTKDLEDKNGCASFFEGGWWYSQCQYCNLNGKSRQRTLGRFQEYDYRWNQWEPISNVIFSTMKIRPLTVSYGISGFL